MMISQGKIDDLIQEIQESDVTSYEDFMEAVRALSWENRQTLSKITETNDRKGLEALVAALSVILKNEDFTTHLSNVRLAGKIAVGAKQLVRNRKSGKLFVLGFSMN